MYIGNNRLIALWLTMMEGQQSLTLCWRSFWRRGRKHFTFTFAYKGSQWSVYDNVQPVAPPDYPWYMTNNCWRSIDAHFHDGAGRVLYSVLPIKAARNSFMTDYDLSEMWFPRTHDEKSLTLRWRSFSWWGKEGIAICCAYKGSQQFLYDWLQPIRGVISQDAWPKIVDDPLTLIFLMGQGGYCYLFCL